MPTYSRDTIVRRGLFNIPRDLVFLQLIGPFTTNAAQTTNDMFLQYSDTVFQISGLTGETVTLNYVDNDQKVIPTAVRPIAATTGHEAASTSLGNGVYWLRQTDFDQYRKLQFTKSAAVEACSIAVACVKEYNP